MRTGVATGSGRDGGVASANAPRAVITAAAAAGKEESRSPPRATGEIIASITKRMSSCAIMEALADSFELKKVLTRSLVMIGAGDLEACKAQAKVIEGGLASLYIRTVEQLKEAFEEPELLNQILSEGFIKGRLLSVLREELKNSQVRSAWKAVLKPKTIKPMNRPLLRRLDVIRVDITNISEINQIDQTFYARVFIILRIKDGMLNDDLVKDFEGFPFDEDGRPTFRPSAKWYLNQLDYPNARDIRTLDSKVTTEGNDLKLIQRIEGLFNQRFCLRDFPFDQQDLTVTLSANCALEGPVPVQFHLGDEPAQLGVDTVNFALTDIYHLFPEVTAKTTTLGASSTRRFPAVQLRVNVQRKSEFIKLNAAMPCSCIALLSLSTFFLPSEDTADRLENTITILLTAVAFRFTTNNYLPMVSYMTVIDKFTLLCTGAIVICFFSHSVLGLLFYWAGVEVEVLEVFNKIFLGVFLATWASANMWFLHKERLITSKNFGGKRRLDEMKNKEEDEGSNEERTSTLSNLTLPSEDEENFDGARDRVDRHFEPMGKDQRKNRKIIYFSVFLFGLILFIAVLASIPKGKKKGDASKNSKMQQGSGSKGSSNVPAVAPKNSLAPTASPSGTPPPPCVDLQVEIRTDELGGQTTWELLLVEAAEVVRERPHADGYYNNRRRGLSSSAGPGGEHAVSGNSGSLRRSLVELVARGGPYPDAAPGSLSGAEEPSSGGPHVTTACLAAGGYEFILDDSGFDGMCCDRGRGGYTLTLGGGEADGVGRVVKVGSGFFTSQDRVGFEVTADDVAGVGGEGFPSSVPSGALSELPSIS